MANHGNTPDWDDEEFSSSGNDEPIFIDDDDYPDDSYNLSDIKNIFFKKKSLIVLSKKHMLLQGEKQ